MGVYLGKEPVSLYYGGYSTTVNVDGYLPLEISEDTEIRGSGQRLNFLSVNLTLDGEKISTEKYVNDKIAAALLVDETTMV